jgi:hypothetical protein
MGGWRGFSHGEYGKRLPTQSRIRISPSPECPPRRLTRRRLQQLAPPGGRFGRLRRRQRHRQISQPSQLLVIVHPAPLLVITVRWLGAHHCNPGGGGALRRGGGGGGGADLLRCQGGGGQVLRRHKRAGLGAVVAEAADDRGLFGVGCEARAGAQWFW